MTDSRVEGLLRALREIAALSDDPDDWEPYDQFGDMVDTDMNNNGDVRDFGARLGRWGAAKIARAALAGPLPAPASEPTISTGWEMAHDTEIQEGPGGTMRLSQRSLSQGAEPASDPKAQPEWGWLIELREGKTTMWWQAGDVWTLDPNCAVRFARKQDAERVMEYFDATKAQAVLHGWDGGIR